MSPETALTPAEIIEHARDVRYELSDIDDNTARVRLTDTGDEFTILYCCNQNRIDIAGLSPEVDTRQLFSEGYDPKLIRGGINLRHQVERMHINIDKRGATDVGSTFVDLIGDEIAVTLGRK